MANYLILRNCPKTNIIIDMVSFEIEGGFRGIKYLPAGLHHISVKSYEGDISNLWFFIDAIDSAEDVIVKVYNPEKSCFIDDDSENTERYKQLALSKEMDDDLLRYPFKKTKNWRNLNPFLYEYKKVPVLNLNSSELDEGAPFKYLTKVLHNNDMTSIIAEFEFSFLRMMLTVSGQKDPDAFARWQEIINIFYNATYDEILENDVLIINWIDSYINQLEEMPDSIFEEDTESEQGNIVIAEIAPFAKQLVESGNKKLKLEGLRLANYFTERGYRV